MRGNQGVYDLERKVNIEQRTKAFLFVTHACELWTNLCNCVTPPTQIYEAAVRGLAPVESPLPIKFPLPNPRNPFSLKPGSIFARFPESKATEMEKSSTLSSAIAGAQAAATQFSKKDQSSHNDAIQNRNIINAKRIGQFESKSWENNKSPAGNFNKGSNRGTQLFVKQGQSSYSEHDGRISSHNQLPRAGSNQHLRPPSKVCKSWTITVGIDLCSSLER